MSLGKGVGDGLQKIIYILAAAFIITVIGFAFSVVYLLNHFGVI